MKVKKTGNSLMKKCMAWILVFAMILPILPMIPTKAADAETLNPELEEISFCNFVDASGVALADGTHSLDKDDWVFQGTYLSQATDAFVNKVINMDITFGGAYGEKIYFGGSNTSIWDGLFLEHPANADYLVFGAVKSDVQPFPAFEILPSKLDGKQLADNQFNFKLSFEIEEEQLKLGVWIDNVLYDNTYIYISDYSTYTTGYIHGYFDEGGSVDIQSYRKQWNWNSPLEQITANDFLLYQGNGAVVEDGTYENKDAKNGAYLLYSSYGAGFSGKVFNVDIKFSDENIMFKVGDNMWNKDMSLYRASGAPENGLYLQYGGVTYTLTQAGAGGVDLTENEFNLKLSFEEEDSDGDLTNDRLKLGVWIDNQLYANTYFYATDYSNYIVGAMGVCAQGVVGGYVKLSSCPPTLNPTLEQFTFSDFYSDISGTYNMSGTGWLVMKEYFSNGTTAGAFAGKVLSGHVTFGSDPFNFRLGSAKSQWSNTFFAFWRNAETPDDAVHFGFNGVTYTLTSDIAQTDLLDNKFNLKISFEEVDTNADGQNDRLRLGLWFNDVLYNDEYFTVDGGYSDFVSGCAFIQGLGKGNGYVKLASYNEKEKEGTYITETNTGDMNRIPYNNDETTADLGLGAASYMVVVDKNNDGYMDLMVGSNCVPFGGTYIFYGGAGSQNVKSKDYLLMEKARKISDLGNTYSATYLLDANGDWEKTLLHGPMVIDNDKATPSWAISDAAEYPTVTALGWRQTVSWPNEIDGDSSVNFNPIRQNLVDFDGDGHLDYITGWGCGDEYSEEEEITGAIVSGDKFDSNGVWGDDNGDRIGDDDGDGDDDPLHAWIVWNKNTGESTELISAKYETESQLVYVYDYEINSEGKKVAIEGSKHPLDVYGGGYPQICDYDNDGDLDIVCVSFICEIVYFENIGTRTEPIYAEGRPLVYVDGTDVITESAMPNLTAFDWNNDGYMDLISGGEDGRVCLIEHSGKFDANGTPIMKALQFFQTPADSLKQGVLNTPYSVDWDGDGDEDIIGGDSSGYIAFIKNLSIEKNQPLTDPIWDNPVRLKNPDGEVYRFKAGYNGSIQGPAEAEWGYTQVSVADWDGDGVLDIMSNNISGRVFWHRGIEGNPYVVEDARAVEVEWEGENLYPTWNWWKPEGKELVTQWRTTPYMIDVPLDEDGDGIAEGDGLIDLVTMDHEGYLSFFQRYRDTDGTLKLKEGQRIFKAADGTTDLRFSSNEEGKSGKISYLLSDFDMDGDLDIIRSNNVNVGMFENIATTPGTYVFRELYGTTGMNDRMLADHTPAPTVCDWNQNGVPDLIVGTMDGHFYYLINPVVTEEEEESTVGPENPADHLVAHWDFEETGDGVYADKATAGTVTDTLTTLNESNVTITDGVASITSNGCLVAADSDDLDQTGKMTIFARVKIAGGAYYSLIDKRAFTATSERAYGIWMNPGSPAGMQPVFSGGAVGTGKLDTGVWREIAMVIDTADNGKLTVKLLMSKNTATADGDDFVTLLEASTNWTALNNSTAALGIGNNPAELSAQKVLRYFDDVRIYNTALSRAQLAELISAEEGDATSYYLSALESNLAISFVPTTTSYAVTTKKDSITLAPKAEDAGVTVKVNGTAVTSGEVNNYSLEVGTNTFTITTTDSAGTVYKTYTITITREEAEQPTLSKEELLAAINTAKAIAQGEYTNGSWMVLQDAITAAQSTYDDAASTEADYYTAKATLDDATAKLTTEFTRAQLLWLVEQAESDYPNDEVVTSLVAAAKETTEKVVSSTKEMEAAYNNLLAQLMGTTTAWVEVKESLAMNYRAVINTDLEETPYMTFIFDGETSEAIAGVKQEDGSYTFTYEPIEKILPQDMAKVITATLTVGKYSKTYEYSVLEYCVDILEATKLSDNNGVAYAANQLTAMKELVVELVQYGKEVQIYGGITGSELLTGKLKGRVADYESYDLKDDDLSVMQTLTKVSSKLTQDSGIAESSDYTWKNVSLVLGNKVKIRARFNANDVENLNVKATIAGVEKEIAYKTDTTEGVYVLDFDEIYAYEYAEEVSFKFYVDGVQVGNTLHYSVNTYLNSMRDYEDETKPLQNLLLAIHNLGNAAEAFQASPKFTSLKILSIGNSFSIDAQEWAYDIAKSLGVDNVELGNLYIGGCTLAQHLSNAQNDNAYYDYYTNTSGSWEKVSGKKISEAVASTDWDYITFQQASGYSGLADSYDDLQALIDIVKPMCPDAKLVWHMTWAYQGNSGHGDFTKYDNNQTTMYNAIVSAVQSKIVTNNNIDIIIPNGTAIQNARTSTLGDTLTRDGYHLSYGLGRYIAGLTFVQTLVGDAYSIENIEYAPSGYAITDEQKAIAIESALNAIETPYVVTQSQYK